MPGASSETHKAVRGFCWCYFGVVLCCSGFFGGVGVGGGCGLFFLFFFKMQTPDSPPSLKSTD